MGSRAIRVTHKAQWTGHIPKTEPVPNLIKYKPCIASASLLSEGIIYISGALNQLFLCSCIQKNMQTSSRRVI